MPARRGPASGSQVERARFTPVEPEYAETLSRCTTCKVYFASKTLEARHLLFNAERERAVPELARLQQLDRQNARGDEEMARLQAAKAARAKEREELKAKVAAIGMEAIVDPPAATIGIEAAEGE